MSGALSLFASAFPTIRFTDCVYLSVRTDELFLNFLRLWGSGGGGNGGDLNISPNTAIGLSDLKMVKKISWKVENMNFWKLQFDFQSKAV